MTVNLQECSFICLFTLFVILNKPESARACCCWRGLLSTHGKNEQNESSTNLTEFVFRTENQSLPSYIHIQPKSTLYDAEKEVFVSQIASVYIRNSHLKTKEIDEVKRCFPICSALLITPKFLLTAAHCLLEVDGELLFKQKIGHWIPQEFYSPYEILLRFGGEPSQRDYIVDGIMLYREVYQFHSNDIVLLRLSEPVHLPSGIKPIRLSPPSIILPPGKRCVAVGWERVKTSTGLFSPVLKVYETYLGLIRRSLDIRKQMHPHLIFAMSRSNETGLTGGGGGLLCKLRQNDEQYFLYGVSTFRLPYTPSLFTYIPTLLKWIELSIGIST